MKIDSCPDEETEVTDYVSSLLDKYSEARGFVYEALPVVLKAIEDDGAVAGGLIGSTLWGWLAIRLLAVEERARGKHVGEQLIQAAFDMARARGCRHAMVDTFSFQARGFYEKLGFRVYGELDDFPPGEKRFFLTMDLPAKDPQDVLLET